MNKNAKAEKAAKDIRRAIRDIHSAEDKIRIVMADLRGEDSIAEPCHREGIACTRHDASYANWSKCFRSNRKIYGTRWLHASKTSLAL